MRLGFITRQATRIAQDEAKEIARIAGLKAILGLAGAVLAIIAVIFAMIGLFILLRQEVGEVLAAFYMSGGCLLLAVLFLLLSARVRKRTNMASQAQRVEAIASEAKKELQSISLYLMLCAFALGFVRGKK